MKLLKEQRYQRCDALPFSLDTDAMPQRLQKQAVSSAAVVGDAVPIMKPKAAPEMSRMTAPMPSPIQRPQQNTEKYGYYPDNPAKRTIDETVSTMWIRALTSMCTVFY